MAENEIRMKAVLDLAGFNTAIGVVNRALSSVGNLVREIGVGAQRYLGEVLIRSLQNAGRAALRFSQDIFKAAFENHALHGTLDEIYNGLVNVARVSFTPLVNEINGLAKDAGPAFLGLVQRAGEYLAGLANGAFNHGSNVVTQFANGMWAAFSYVVQALTDLGNLITYWLSPGSPPRLLPHLDDWGREAVNVWLSGWGKGDFGVFNKISSTLTALIRSFADPLGTGEGLIPQILGTREGIARAVDELRQTGAVSAATLDSIIASVGNAGASVRRYLESMIALEAANADVAAAQALLTKATSDYEALLKPIDDRLSAISETEQQLAEDQRKRMLAFVLADPNATASEKRKAALELERIDAERARRAAVLQGEAAVDAAQDQLTAAEMAQVVAQDAFDTETARLQLLTEQNQLWNDQLKLLDKLGDVVTAASAKAAAAIGGVKKAMQANTAWIDDLIAKIKEKLAPLQEAWDKAWAAIKKAVEPVWVFIRDEVIPLLLKLWGIVSTKGGEAIETLKVWWNETFIPMLKKAWEWIDLHILPVLSKMWDWLEVQLPRAIAILASFFVDVLLPAFLSILTTTLLINAAGFAKMWEWMETNLPSAGRTFAAAVNATVVPVFFAIRREADLLISRLQTLWEMLTNVSALAGALTGNNGLGTGYLYPQGSNGGGGGGAGANIIPPGMGGVSNNNSVSNSQTNNWNYAPNYGGTPASPQHDFAIMQVLAPRR